MTTKEKELDTTGLLPPFQGEKKVEIIETPDTTMVTIILHEEDHTMGNSLKHILCSMPDVEFCGYNVPHPLEDKILLRVQTKNGVPARRILVDAFNHLETIFTQIGKMFETAYAKK
ncbi:unnamed protein product, partial [Mesorhabditis spiculigera]